MKEAVEDHRASASHEPRSIYGKIVAEADRDLGVTFIISPTITAEELGFTKKNLKEIAAKHNQGFYVTLIDSLPIENKEKKRLLRDADIQDAEIVEELPND